MRKRSLIACAATAALFLSAVLSGCAKEGAEVAFLIYDSDDTFIAETMAAIEANASFGVPIKIRDAENSQAVQNQQIVELLDSGADLLVVNAVDRLACSAIVEKCAAEGAGVIFFNREPAGDALAGEKVHYVGAAADSLGKKQADMVAGLFGSFLGGTYDKNADGVIQLVIIKGEQGHQDAEKRTEHCVSRLQELGYSAEVLAVEVADWVRREGAGAMERLYGRFGEEIELVFSNNDDMALGAIDYLLEENIFSPRSAGEYRQPFVLVGVDGTGVGLEAIESGLL
ncbi:MAG: substrate-binding domain-containing protein, partial [Oscillospiraceae bacterium]|nr:substrate-binding domain-containing protein [Oscillospiraceae bacterium]